MEDDHNTKTARVAGVEKHSCQIELRGAHVKLVYYNNKKVLRVYIMLHVTVVLYVRSEDEVIYTGIYTYIYIPIHTHTHTHTHTDTAKYSFNILARYL